MSNPWVFDNPHPAPTHVPLAPRRSLRTVCITQPTKETSGLTGKGIYPGCVDLDTAIEGAGGLLKVDRIPLPKESHIVEYINQRHVPGVIGIDFLRGKGSMSDVLMDQWLAR